MGASTSCRQIVQVRTERSSAMSTQLRWWHSGQTHSYPWHNICRWGIAIRHRSKEAYSIPSQSMLSSATRSEEHTSDLQSLMRASYAVFCLNKKKKFY